jgi:hypothetical protein
MQESLIGHEARFSFPCKLSVVALLMGFIEELLMVEGHDIEDPEGLEQRLGAAFEEICGGEADSGTVKVILSVVSEGLEVRLSSPGGEPALDPIIVLEE